MSNTLKIVDRVRSMTGTGTDYAVAKALGMRQTNLKPVLLGKAYLGDKAQRHAAKLLGIAFDDINALVNEDKAKTESERSYWRSLCAEGVRQTLDAAGKVAAAFIIGTGLIGLTPRAQAEGLVQPFFSAEKISQIQQVMPVTQTIHYAQRLARRFRRWLDGFKRSSVTAMCPA